MFYCKFCETFKNILFYRTPPIAASDPPDTENPSISKQFLHKIRSFHLKIFKSQLYFHSLKKSLNENSLLLLCFHLKIFKVYNCSRDIMKFHSMYPCWRLAVQTSNFYKKAHHHGCFPAIL